MTSLSVIFLIVLLLCGLSSEHVWSFSIIAVQRLSVNVCEHSSLEFTATEDPPPLVFLIFYVLSKNTSLSHCLFYEIICCCMYT